MQTDKRLKIGMALESIHRYGGLTRSAWELSQHMGRNHDVIFFTTHAELTGTETFQVKILKIPNIPYIKKWIFAWKVSRQKKIHSLDILNVHGTSGLWQDVVTAQSVHKKWFSWSLNQTKAFSFPWVRKLLNPVHYFTIGLELIQYNLGFTKKVIAISNQVKKDLLEQFTLSSDKVEVIHHGVNTSEFDPKLRKGVRDKIRSASGIGPDQKVIVFAAHEFRRKGLSILLEAVAKAQDRTALLLVIGQDDPNPFKAIVHQLDLADRVRFLGRQNNLHEWYAASDVFAFPTSYEAFGMVITEAMAAGLPVIVPHDAGAAELITHNVDGLLLTKWNAVEELVSALNQLDDPEVRTRIGMAARQRVEAWTWADAADKTLELYYAILR